MTGMTVERYLTYIRKDFVRHVRPVCAYCCVDLRKTASTAVSGCEECGRLWHKECGERYYASRYGKPKLVCEPCARQEL